MTRRSASNAAKGDITALGAEFSRTIARTKRLRRRSTDEAWSLSVDHALDVAEFISREPARDIGDLAVKFDAAYWWLVEDDSVLDKTAMRWLRQFRKSLALLANSKNG